MRPPLRTGIVVAAALVVLGGCSAEEGTTTSTLGEPPTTTVPAPVTAPTTSSTMAEPSTTLRPPVTTTPTTTTVPETTTTVGTMPVPDVFDPAAYVGLVYAAGGLAGVQETGGALIDFTTEPDVPIYAVNIVRSGDTSMLLFDLGVGQLDDGTPVWQVLDAVTVPPLGPDDGISLQSCSFNGIPDQEIVAVTRQDIDKEILDEVSIAWRANRLTGLFEQVAPALVACVNEASGI